MNSNVIGLVRPIFASKLSLCLGFCLALLLFQNAGLTADKSAKNTSSVVSGAQLTDKTRVFVFPEGVSVGRLVALLPNSNFCNRHLGGRPICEARGKVTVPAGTALMLIGSDALLDHIECLDKLPADALTAIVLDRTEVGDDQIAHMKHLTGLQYGDFHATDLSDKSLVYLASLTNLIYLDISHTMVKGAGFNQLSRLQKLRYLDIGYNGLLPGAIAGLGKLAFPDLIYLHACASGLKDKDLGFFSNFVSLLFLEITDNNDVTDKGMSRLLGLKKLCALDLRRTPVTLKGLMQLRGLPLKNVTLSATHPLIDEEKALQKAFPGIRVGFERPNTTTPKELFDPLH